MKQAILIAVSAGNVATVIGPVRPYSDAARELKRIRSSRTAPAEGVIRVDLCQLSSAKSAKFGPDAPFAEADSSEDEEIQDDRVTKVREAIAAIPEGAKKSDLDAALEAISAIVA